MVSPGRQESAHSPGPSPGETDQTLNGWQVPDRFCGPFIQLFVLDREGCELLSYSNCVEFALNQEPTH
jgi:hypothetical protein